MRQKRAILIFLAVLFLFSGLFLISNIVILPIVEAQTVYGCCISASGGCEDQKTQTECTAITGIFNSGSTCASLNDNRCQKGCCCQTGSANPLTDKIKCQETGETFYQGTFTNVQCRSKCNLPPPQCTNYDCSAATVSDNIGCACGNVNTTAENSWCCLATSSVHSIQSQCPTACISQLRYTIEGIVRGRDQNTGNVNPLKNTTVTILGGQSNLTDENGRYSISGLTPGTYQIQFEKSRFQTHINRTVTIIATSIVYNPILMGISVVSESCTTVDDDGNGYSGACDAACNPLHINIKSHAPPAPYGNASTETSCSDGFDNDCNGLIDCSDPACTNDNACKAGGICGDNIRQLPNTENQFEECDGIDSILCPGQCIANGADKCKCPVVCGDLLLQNPPRGNEQCDAKYDTNNNKIGGFDMACQGRCNATSCQCNPIVPVCGNNLREIGEECDGADNYACGGFACVPSGQPNQCTCKRDFICGDGKVDVYEDCDKGNPSANPLIPQVKCPNNIDCPSNCQCPISCNQNPIEPTLNPIATQKYKKNFALTWTLDSTLCQPTFYSIIKCEGTQQECSSKPIDAYKLIATNLQTKQYDDKDLENNTNYCYKVVARYDAANIDPIQDKVSSIQCKTTGDKECYERTTEFCSMKSRFDCSADNNKFMAENCTIRNDFECIGPFADGTTKCAFQSPCDDCNDPLGAFALHPSARALYSETGLSPVLTLCKDLSVCYFDTTVTPIDKYYPCSFVHSCYDYRNANGCIADAAKCKVGPCEWLPNQFSELGGGVCRPKVKEKQECGRCDNPFNAFLGRCDKQACALYGDCYYNGYMCKNKDALSCADYREKTECAPTRNVAVDVTYTQSVRSNGSHKIITKSDDLFNLSKCRWMEERNQCIKDTDGDTQDDCMPDDTKCNNDMQPPITLVNPTQVTTGKIRIPFSVLDNQYLGDKIKTYYSIDTKWTYPITLAKDNVFSMDITDQMKSGYYYLTYYSMDDAKNLEEVKSFKFYVDTVPPSILLTWNTTSNELPNGDFRSSLNVNLATSDNVGPKVVCSGNLTKNNVLVQPVTNTGLRNVPITSHTIQYTGLSDAEYVFAYECVDRAGNIVSKQEMILVQGDLSITNPLPSGTIPYNQNIRISVNTAENAVCKYSELTDNYTLMGSTLAPEWTNGTKHYAVVNVPSILGVKNYYVRCNFPRVDKIKGNSADNIKFAVDMIPPTTTVNYNGDYLHGQTNFQLTCRDPELIENNFHWEFKCDKTYYCLGLGCNATTLYTGSIVLNQSTQITYYSIDKGGNKELPKIVSPIIDSVPPTFAISILDILQIPPVVNTVTRIYPPNYIINITASEPLLNVTQLIFTYPNGTVNLINVTQPYPINIEKTEWHAQMALYNVRNVYSPAHFGIRAFDENRVEGTSITQGRDFTIDTRIADPPTLDPPLGAYTYLKGGIYYTNIGTHIMSGFTKLLLMTVNYYLGIFNDDIRLKNSYIEPETSIIANATLEEDAIAGATTIKFRNELPITNEHYVEFIYVDSTSGGHTRSYPNYKDYYKITSVQKSGGITTITIEPGLEASVFRNKVVNVYDKPRPANRFTGAINLTNSYNYLRLNGYQSIYNPTPFTPIAALFYDFTPPEIIDMYPGEDWTIGYPLQIMNVKVRELKSGSGIDSFNVFVNGMKLVEAPQAYTDENNPNYNLMGVSHRDTFDQAKYDVRVLLNDTAMNTVEYNYSFYFIANTPNPPTFSVADGKKINNRWYVKNTPAKIAIEFSQPSNLRLPLSPNVIDPSTITQTGQIYNASLRSLNDGVYSVRVEASLIGQSAVGHWNYTVVVDKSPPDFNLDYQRKARSGRSVRINANVLNELGDLNGTIKFNTYRINETFVKASETFEFPRTANGLYSYDLKIGNEVPHGVKIIFEVTLKDVLGNLLTKTGEIEIDNIVPGIEIVRIEADKVISYTVGEDIFYNVRDNDDNINIVGRANKMLNLQYFKEKLLPVTLNSQNQFTLPIKLISLEGDTIPNYITFKGTDTETGLEVIYIVKIISDKQAPSPPIIVVSTMENGKVRTPLPIITATYNEPVRIVSLGLKEDSAKTFTTSTTDNQTYVFTVIQPLVNKQYTFQVKAEDALGNAQKVFSEQKFILEANDTQITMNKPRHGAAQSVPVDIEILTIRYATCSYAFSATGVYSRFPETGLEQQKLLHKLPNFNQISATSATAFYVKCNDGLKDISATFSLILDNKAPVIKSAVAEPATINQQPLQTTLKIETDEQTVCKYSKTSTNYGQMDFYNGEDANSRNTFRLLHGQIITLPNVQAGAHTYTVNCEDPAGNLAGNKQITFNLIDENLTLVFEQPLAVTGDSRVIVKVKTTKDAECFYTRNSTTELMQGTQKNHLIDLGVLPDGTYSGSVKCTSYSDLYGARLQEKTQSHTFIVDTSPPYLNTVTVSNASCPSKQNGKYSLNAIFSGIDNESEIEGYNYTVVSVDKMQVIVPDTSSASTQVFLNNLNFTPGQSYLFSAIARNKLRKVSNEKTSDPILVYNANSSYCLESNPPELNIDVKQTPKGISVSIICKDVTGCDSNTIKYGFASEGSCSSGISYTGPIEVNSQKTLCATACDVLGNCMTTQVTKELSFADEDFDGIPDWADKCLKTAAGDVVDIEGPTIGCSEAQKVKDTDKDGVNDDLDKCANTPEGESVNTDGCSESQLKPEPKPEPTPIDSDYDGVSDDRDTCANTAAGTQVDANGCPIKTTPILPLILLFLGLLLIFAGAGYLVYKKYYSEPVIKEEIKPSEELTAERARALEEQRKIEQQRQYLEEKRREAIRQKLNEREEERKKIFESFGKPTKMPTAAVKETVKPKGLQKVKPLAIEKKYTTKKNIVMNVFNKLTSMGNEDVFARLEEIGKHDANKKFEELKKLPKEEVPKENAISELAKVSGIEPEKVQKITYEEIREVTHPKVEVHKNIAKQMLSATQREEIRNDVEKGIKVLREKEKITSDDIIKFISSLPKNERVDMYVTQILFTHLLQHNKIKPEEVSSILIELEKKNILSAEDVIDITLHLHIK